MRLEIYNSNKLNFVELNTTGNNDSYKKCDEDSKYVDTEVFNLFAHCFEKSEKLYDYFGPTKYNSRNIVPLKNELLNNLKLLEDINSKDDFITFIGDIFLGKEFILKVKIYDKNWDDNWELYVVKLKEINKNLLSIIDECIAKERFLWVIGY